MTNTLAVILGLMILTAILLDTVFNGANGIVFLGKKFTVLLEWVAFWR